MMNLQVTQFATKFKRLDESAVLPKAANPGDALDLSAIERVVLKPHIPAKIRTGWAIEMPKGFRGWITPRSGLALNHGVTVWNSPGLIDEQYRGEVCVIALWSGHNGNEWLHSEGKLQKGEGDYVIMPGNRIAQFTIERFEPYYVIEEFGELSETARGENGFGSTGR